MIELKTRTEYIIFCIIQILINFVGKKVRICLAKPVRLRRNVRVQGLILMGSQSLQDYCAPLFYPCIHFSSYIIIFTEH